MNNWILARGRAAEQTLAEVTPAGARSLALAGAGSLFAPPQKLFISEADGRETEWLGRVTAATASALAFSHPLHASKNSGARLWRAASAIEFPPESARITRATTASGVTAETAADGTPYAIQTAQPRTLFQLYFEDLTPAAELNVTRWLAEQTRWGLDLFTLIQPDGRLFLTGLASDPVQLECDAKGRRRLSFGLTILLEGAYQ
jgi:hypothetical protein